MEKDPGGLVAASVSSVGVASDWVTIELLRMTIRKHENRICDVDTGRTHLLLYEALVRLHSDHCDLGLASMTRREVNLAWFSLIIIEKSSRQKLTLSMCHDKQLARQMEAKGRKSSASNSANSSGSTAKWPTIILVATSKHHTTPVMHVCRQSGHWLSLVEVANVEGDDW